MSGYHERITTSTTNLEITKRIHLINGNPEQMGLFLEDLREMLREGLLSLCTAAGLSVLQTLMEADVAALAGPKGKHLPDRKANRHGTERTSVGLGGQKIGITRPRVRTCGEEGKE